MTRPSTGSPVLARGPEAPAEGPLGPELDAALEAAEPDPGIPLFLADAARLLNGSAGLMPARPELFPEAAEPFGGAAAVFPAPAGWEFDPGMTDAVAGAHPAAALPPMAAIPCTPQEPAWRPLAGEPAALLEPAAPASVPLAVAADPSGPQVTPAPPEPRGPPLTYRLSSGPAGSILPRYSISIRTPLWDWR